MAGPLSELLQADHARLDDLLRRADESPHAIHTRSYESFRAGLLRHIAIEEKVLLPPALRIPGAERGALVELAAQLRADHAALAALLIPSPTRELIATIRDVLAEHNPLEEGAGGFYERCELQLGDAVAGVLERVHATPRVALAPHRDGRRVLEHIERLLRARVR